MRELFRHRTPVLRTAPGGHFASLRSRSVNRLAVLFLSYFQCSKLFFSSERSYLRELFRHRTPVLRTAPGRHFASLRSRSVNRLVVLLLSYSVFQCSKLFFSSERLYHARIVPPSYPRPSDCPQGPLRFPPVAVGKPTRRSAPILCFFQCSKFHSRRSGVPCANCSAIVPPSSGLPPGAISLPSGRGR